MSEDILDKFKDAIDCTEYLESYDEPIFTKQSVTDLYQWVDQLLDEDSFTISTKKIYDYINTIIDLINKAYENGYQQGKDATELKYVKKTPPKID